METQNNLQASSNEKDLGQPDRYSDSKSPRHSHSESNSPNYNSRNRKSSEMSGFEQGQRDEQKYSSQNFQSKKDQPKLDFLIFISTKIKDSLLDNKILDSIISQIGGIQMDFDLNIKIPEYSKDNTLINTNVRFGNMTYQYVVKVKMPTYIRESEQNLLKQIQKENS